MDTNIVRDITDIYFEHIVESSHLETDMKKRRKDNEKAVEDMKKTKAHRDMAATAAKKFDEGVVADRARSAVDNQRLDDEQSDTQKSVDKLRKGNKRVTRASASIAASKSERTARGMHPKAGKTGAYRIEALDPVGKEDDDVDNDGKKNTKSDKYLLNRRKAVGKAIATQEAKEVKRWWDDDGDGKGYEEGEVSGKFKKKKKIKEGFSNWREDLVELKSVIERDKNDEKITEKNIENKIVINPSVAETVENLGGTLLEMIEIDEVDFVVESVYGELLDEGYGEDDIEEALEYALTEATVTFGHDTDKPQQKKSGAGHLVKAVGRLARKKLASKVQGSKKAVAGAVAKGARKVAKGALGVARKMEGGDKTPSTAHTSTRKASTYRGAGAGQKEKVSSGSYTPPTKKKAEKPSDPWEGSASTPPKAKAKAKTKKPAAPKAAAKTPAKKKKTSKLDDLLASVRADESVNLGEKTLTAAEKRKREEIAQSMNLSDFERRYPGRGMEVKMATATKMAKKIAEQAMELQPKTQPKPETSPQSKKIQQQQDRVRQQEVQILQRKLQALRSAPKGTDPSITA